MNRSMYYFKEICKIPHGSGNCGAIADYIVDFAARCGLEYIRDSLDNVIVKKPASPGREGDPAVMIQGHTDMVCEKENGVDFDFLTQGLKLVENGDILKAEGTTLGGDDGAAVALMLSLLEDKELSAPALECVFTTDEEVGMLGAVDIDLSSCRAKYLINADSEEEGVFTCGCAGGTGLDFSIPVKREALTGEFCHVSVSGLLGGHSGTEINKGRLNGIKLLASLLSSQDRIVSIERDGKDNAIPARCDAVIFGNGEDIRRRFDAVTDFGSEKNVSLDIESLGERTENALDEASNEKVLTFLQQVPYGVKKMCDEPEGLVHTSDNIGILASGDDFVSGTLSVRSICEDDKNALCDEISALVESAGGTTELHGGYPGWNYKKNSPLRDTMTSVYKEMYGTEPKIDVIHAGLECGVILSKMPDLDIVSMGCTLWDIHTPDERMSISSFLRMEDFVRRVLGEIK